MSLELQQAQGRWVQDVEDNQWVIYDAEGNELGKLPAKLIDQEVMNVIRFGREYELKAYNDGVEEGLRRGSDATKVNRLKAANRIQELESMNENLAEKLERYIIGEDED